VIHRIDLLEYRLEIGIANALGKHRRERLHGRFVDGGLDQRIELALLRHDAQCRLMRQRINSDKIVFAGCADAGFESGRGGDVDRCAIQHQAGDTRYVSGKTGDFIGSDVETDSMVTFGPSVSSVKVMLGPPLLLSTERYSHPARDSPSAQNPWRWLR